MSQNLRDRVKKGAAWLDANYPGWAQTIDVDQLDLSNSCDCVLGQVTGGCYASTVDRMMMETSQGLYVAGTQSVPLGGLLNRLLRRTREELVYLPIPNRQWPVEHGFDIYGLPISLSYEARRAAYKPLGDLWIEEIAERVHPITAEKEQEVECVHS